MPDSEARLDRDRSSARLSARNAKEENNGYHSWALEEVRDLCMLAALIDTASSDAALIDRVAIIKARLIDLRDNDIENVYSSVDDKITEIYDGDAFVDPVDARDYLKEGLCRFEAIQRELLKVRRTLDEIWAAS